MVYLGRAAVEQAYLQADHDAAAKKRGGSA
jgi:hypothetical protein